MKSPVTVHNSRQTGSALLLTLIMTVLALATLAAILGWSLSTARLTYRSNQYTRSVAAAEGVTEKVLGQILQDFLSGGEKLVNDNMGLYRQATLSSSESSYWADWEFNDASGHTGQNYVQQGSSSNYVVLNSTYSGLRGFVTTYTVVST